MQVVSDHFGRDREEALEVVDALTERCQGLQILQIADVMADKRLSSFTKAECVFKLTTASQDWYGQFMCQKNRLRSIAARTAEELLTASDDSHDGIITAHMNI